MPPVHAELAGLRIGFVSDTHVGPLVSPDDLARAAKLLESERPDLVLLGGDFISDAPRFAEAAAEVLGRLASAAPLGAYAVLGNHDVANDAARVTAALDRRGIKVLRNEAVPVHIGHGALWIVGIDEAIVANADPAAAFRNVPDGAAAIALWHEPDGAARVAALGAFAQLSGHSHGGQVRLPILGAPFTPPGGRRYVIGLNHANGMPVYTSRGVGFYRPPLRFNCPPEVTLVALVAPPECSTAACAEGGRRRSWVIAGHPRQSPCSGPAPVPCCAGRERECGGGKGTWKGGNRSRSG